jgi:hypothetical protein
MYILPHLCVVKLLNFLNSRSILESSLNFLSFKIPHILGYDLFLLMWLTLLPSNVFYYMNPFDSSLQNWLMSHVLMCTFKGPKSKLILKISSNRFLIWIHWHSYEWKNNEITCHDFHGFKWQNINNYPILIIFLFGQMPFLVCWIVIATTNVFSCKNMFMCLRPQHKLDSKSVVCIFITYCTKKKTLDMKWRCEKGHY